MASTWQEFLRMSAGADHDEAIEISDDEESEGITSSSPSFSRADPPSAPPPVPPPPIATMRPLPLSNVINSDIFSQRAIPKSSFGPSAMRWTQIQRNENLRQECMKLSSFCSETFKENLMLDEEIIQRRAELQKLKCEARIEKQTYNIISDYDLKRIGKTSFSNMDEVTTERKNLKASIANLISDNRNINLRVEQYLTDLREVKAALKLLHECVVSLPDNHVEFQACRAEGEYAADDSSDDVDSDEENENINVHIVNSDSDVSEEAAEAQVPPMEAPAPDPPANLPGAGDSNQNILAGQGDVPVDLEVEGQVVPQLNDAEQGDAVEGAAEPEREDSEATYRVENSDEADSASNVSSESGVFIGVLRLSQNSSVTSGASSSAQSGAEISRDKVAANKEHNFFYYTVKSEYIDENRDPVVTSIVESQRNQLGIVLLQQYSSSDFKRKQYRPYPNLSDICLELAKTTSSTAELQANLKEKEAGSRSLPCVKTPVSDNEQDISYEGSSDLMSSVETLEDSSAFDSFNYESSDIEIKKKDAAKNKCCTKCGCILS